MKNSLSGWKDVFTFTLAQVLKSKAYRVSYFLLVLLVIISMPLITTLLFNNKEDEVGPTPINKVYVDNKTSLSDIDFSGLKTNIYLAETEFVPMDEDYNTIEGRIKDEEYKSVILTITEDSGQYNFNLKKSAKGPIEQSHFQRLGDLVSFEFNMMRMRSNGISDEQINLLLAPVSSNVTMYNKSAEPIINDDSAISFSEYWFIYGILFFVLMANMLSGTQVATSVLTEKSTRVVEYLLITVKPLALMIGKVFAMLTAALIQMLSMVIGMFVSNKITATLSSEGESLLVQLLPADMFNNFNLFNFILCIILVFLGMLFYAVLAGLAGATVSRMEELNEGLTLFSVISLIGVYIGLGAASTLMGGGTSNFVIFAYLFPLSSPFVLPGAILIGKASLPLVGIAIILEVVFIILLLRFVAKVYETLILHNGNTIKLKQLFKLSKHSTS